MAQTNVQATGGRLNIIERPPYGPTTSSDSSMDSASIREVNDATEVCRTSANALCDQVGATFKNSRGNDGDELLARTRCFSSSVFAENIAANDRDGHAPTKCRNSYATSVSDPSVTLVNRAALDCKEETTAKYRARGSTGNARLVSAICKLSAAHGGYERVK